MFRIYTATNKVNGKIYVGKESGKPFSRRYQHEYLAKNGSNVYFHKALRKYGMEAFEWAILLECDSDSDSLIMESKEIRKLRDLGKILYNVTGGGEGGSKYTKEDIILAAQKFSSPKDWQKLDKPTYLAACKRGILEECERHMFRSYGNWTPEKCIDAAKSFICVSEWAKKDRKSYDAAHYHKCFDECKRHMTPLRRKQITREMALARAAEFKTIKDLLAADASIYMFLCTNKLLHLVEFEATIRKTKYENIMCSNGIVYKTLRDAEKDTGVTLSCICKSLKSGKSSKGFTFSLL